MTKQAHIWAAIGILLAGAASTASAGTVIATLNGQPLNRAVAISRDFGQTYSNVIAGQMQWQRTGGDHQDKPVGQFKTFCIELTQQVAPARSYTFDVVEVEQAPSPGGSGVGLGMQSQKANFIRELWGRFYDQVVDANTSAAFQLAVWEIIYDDGLALHDGSFMVRPKSTQPAYITLADQWLGSLNGDGPMAHLEALSSPTAQDQVFAAPIPAAAWGGLALLVPLVSQRVRKAFSKA